MTKMRDVSVLALVALVACAPMGGRGGSSEVRVGPPKGSVVVVGGGALDRAFYTKFIELAGGPDSLIVSIPTASGAAAYTQDDGSARAFRAAGAKNVVVLHTSDRSIADADSFVAPIRRARGVWFGGGRHYRLVDSYAGTKSETAFHDVLARGGVVGGSSAGASILASFLVRGAPSNDNLIMAHPRYLKGFGFLRGVAIDQHVVARGRLPDLADSIITQYPDLLGISEDEGTSWVVRGDTGEIIGASKAFVYNGRDRTDAGKPFLTLLPGDKYDLAARRVVHRAIAESKLTQRFVDSLLTANVGSTAATVLVARGGKILVNSSYNVPPQPRHQPTTTMPNFALGGISDAMMATIAEPLARRDSTPAFLAQRLIMARSGMAHTRFDAATGTIMSNVDNLYRWDRTLSADSSTLLRVYGTPDGKRNALVRDPTRLTTIIILTASDAIDARAIADRIAERMF